MILTLSMEGELGTFVKVWLTAFISACYCYTLSKSTKPNAVRFLLVLPVAALFAALPFSLSTCHLAGTSFFFLTWLGISKLLLFSFGSGPLSQPGLSLSQFVCTLLLPIKLRLRSEPNSFENSGSRNAVVVGVVKVVGFGCLIKMCNYKERLPSFVLPVLYLCHTYLALEMILGLSWALARAAIGPEVEIAPQSNKPYLSTSLQDFWGRRWNLMTSDTLKHTVLNPIRSFNCFTSHREKNGSVGRYAHNLCSFRPHARDLILPLDAPKPDMGVYMVLHRARSVSDHRGCNQGGCKPQVAAATSRFNDFDPWVYGYYSVVVFPSIF